MEGYCGVNGQEKRPSCIENIHAALPLALLQGGFCACSSDATTERSTRAPTTTTPGCRCRILQPSYLVPSTSRASPLPTSTGICTPPSLSSLASCVIFM